MASIKTLFSSGTNPTPKVSVIIITFNNQRLIENTINSVLSQKIDFRIEIIICDDCSSDRTITILKSLHHKFPKIIKIVDNHMQKGETRCFISALKECTGEYIAICKMSDTWTDKHKLKRQVEYMDRHPECQLSYHRVAIENKETGKKIYSNSNLKKNRVISALQIAKGEEINASSVMYRQSGICISSLPEWLIDMYEIDYFLNVMAVSKGNACYLGNIMTTSVIDSNIGVNHLLRVQRLRKEFDIRLNTLKELSQDSYLYSAVQESMIEIIVSIISEGESGHGLSLVPLTGIDISIEELRKRAELKTNNSNKKISLVSRMMKRLLAYITPTS